MKNKELKKITSILSFLIIPFVIILFLLYFMLAEQNPMILYPGENLITTAFSDQTEPSGGNSIITGFNVNPKSIGFSYLLKKGFSNPYAGFSLYKKKIMDLNSYNKMKIKISSTLSSSVRIFLIQVIPGYSSPSRYTSYLYRQKEIALSNECREYTINFTDFHTPEWWHEIELSENDPRLEIDFSQIFSVSIHTGITQATDIEDTLIVEEVGFYKSNNFLVITLCSLLIIYIIIGFLFIRLKRSQQTLATKINRITLVERNETFPIGFDNDMEKIIRYIGINYSDSELTVNRVSQACGLPIMKIPLWIKKHFGLSFPQYLNAIRLTEAKRLLNKTELKISKIVTMVGFNSIPHFNRLFRAQEGLSPGDYRKKNRDY